MTIMHPLISLIIPVYNVEKYFAKCLDSVLVQQFLLWEALLVDDGSTDRSGIICDEYAAKDTRFRVFHKSNGGVSSARNVGLDNARGEWIWFVDPDDWIADNAISILAHTVNGKSCDTVFFGIEYFDENGILIGKEIRERLLNTAKDHTIALEDYPPQNYLAKRQIIEDFNLRFSEGVATGEDLEFQYKYFMMCQNPVSIDKCLYGCLRRQGSAMRSPQTKVNMAKDSPRILHNLVEFILKHDITESAWLAARLNRTFKAVMSSNYTVCKYRAGVQSCIRDAAKKLRGAGFCLYEDTAIKIGVFNVRLYYMFQTFRRLLRR